MSVQNHYFFPKLKVKTKKRKRSSSLSISVQNLDFYPKLKVKTKKRSSVFIKSMISTFILNLWCRQNRNKWLHLQSFWHFGQVSKFFCVCPPVPSLFKKAGREFKGVKRACGTIVPICSAFGAPEVQCNFFWFLLNFKRFVHVWSFQDTHIRYKTRLEGK